MRYSSTWIIRLHAWYLKISYSAKIYLIIVQIIKRCDTEYCDNKRSCTVQNNKLHWAWQSRQYLLLSLLFAGLSCSIQYSSSLIHEFHGCDCHDFPFGIFSSYSEPRWASVNRGVLICDECCSVHRSLGRHSSQVRHLTHTPWPATQLQVTEPHTRKYYIFLCKAGRFCCVVPSEMSCDNSSIPCILQVTEMYWFGQHKESDVKYYQPVSIIWCKYFSFYLPVDGSDIIQQWSKFNMGALSSGPILCDEWKAQSQPSGQTAVSRYVFENEEGLFLSTSC